MTRRARGCSAIEAFAFPSVEEMIELTIALGRADQSRRFAAAAFPSTRRRSTRRRRAATAGVRNRTAWPAGRRSDPWRRRIRAPDRCLSRDSEQPRSAAKLVQALPAARPRFKAVVIGGGYATGRELAEFFLPRGPRGGLLRNAVRDRCWCLCLRDDLRRSRGGSALRLPHLLQARCSVPAGSLFELAYLLFVVLILAVYGAAAGAIAAAVFGAPAWVGTRRADARHRCCRRLRQQGGRAPVRDVSYLLYGVYALFMVFALARSAIGSARLRARIRGIGLGDGRPDLRRLQYRRRGHHPAGPPPSDRATAMRSSRASSPGRWRCFRRCCSSFRWSHSIRDSQSAALPSDFLLQQLGLPWFHLLFQAMIFAALLESGTSAVHAVNERIDAGLGGAQGGAAVAPRAPGDRARSARRSACFAAGRFGLVALIANGYRALAYIFLAVFVLPLLTIGVWRLRKRSRGDPALQN